MELNKRLSFSLLAMRLTVFLVMFMWTIDKFINPDHAASVYEKFYFIGGMGSAALFIFGAIELVIILGFVLGLFKKWTYGAVLVLHAVSTLSSMGQYFNPFHGPNLLFFAAWPMLAAALALFLLRDQDTLWAVGKG